MRFPLICLKRRYLHLLMKTWHLLRKSRQLDDQVDNYYAETYKKITEYLRATSRRNNTARTIIIRQSLS